MAYPNTLLGRLDEAIAWFEERVPLTDEERQLITDNAKREAFWVAGTQQLGAVRIIQDSLAKAIEVGQTFEQWRVNIGPTFQEAVKNHARTVYRNATQSSYLAGRRSQMREPVVKRARPFWMYNAVGGKSGDGRTTDLCRGLHGTILPADDPRWARLAPPNHHNCRSNLRAITSRQMNKFGGVKAPTNDNDIPESWAAQPTADGLANSYPGALVDVLRTREAQL